MLEGRGIEQKGKRTHGHGQQCGDGRGWGSRRGIHDNGKNTIKIIIDRLKKEIYSDHFYHPDWQG